MSIVIAKYFHKKEERWLAYKKKGDAERANAMTLEGANELAIAASRRRRSEYEMRRSFSARRMSERQTDAFREGVRESLARRAATENDVTHTRDGKKKKKDSNKEEWREKRGNSFNPGVPAIPPRKTQQLARAGSSRDGRVVSPKDTRDGRDQSLDLRRTMSPENMG